jgi:hypothetical protein
MNAIYYYLFPRQKIPILPLIKCKNCQKDQVQAAYYRDMVVNVNNNNYRVPSNYCGDCYNQLTQRFGSCIRCREPAVTGLPFCINCAAGLCAFTGGNCQLTFF